MEEDTSIPVEFRCPITQMVMKKPVVATDGHSYELKAMQKWLLKKQTSPVTGKPLVSANLILNQNLKKLIRDFKPNANPDATSAPKRKAPDEDDSEGGGLFPQDDDDDDDDGPAYRHATFGPAMSDLIPPIGEGASSSTAVARPKRMKAPRRK